MLVFTAETRDGNTSSFKRQRAKFLTSAEERKRPATLVDFVLFGRCLVTRWDMSAEIKTPRYGQDSETSESLP